MLLNIFYWISAEFVPSFPLSTTCKNIDFAIPLRIQLAVRLSDTTIGTHLFHSNKLYKNIEAENLQNLKKIIKNL